MIDMKERIGRLNITRFLTSNKVCKIAIVKEEKRPYRLLTEKWAIEQAGKLGANTPETLEYSTDMQKREVLTLKCINGKNIRYLPLHGKCECLYSVGRQMKSLKSPIKGFGWIDLNALCGTSSDWKSFLYSYAEIYGGNIAKKKVISLEDLNIILRLLENIPVEIQTPFLVNRDIKPSNIIRCSEGKTWIIDWENTVLGDPLFDLSIFGGNYGRGKLWESLLKGYGFVLPPLKYFIYQAIALFGTIDFCIKYKAPYAFRRKRLEKTITILQYPENISESANCFF